MSSPRCYLELRDRSQLMVRSVPMLAHTHSAAMKLSLLHLLFLQNRLSRRSLLGLPMSGSWHWTLSQYYWGAPHSDTFPSFMTDFVTFEASSFCSLFAFDVSMTVLLAYEALYTSTSDSLRSVFSSDVLTGITIDRSLCC